jgi:hypothetical protein
VPGRQEHPCELEVHLGAVLRAPCAVALDLLAQDAGGVLVAARRVQGECERDAQLSVVGLELDRLLEERHRRGWVAPLVHVQRGRLTQVAEPLGSLHRTPGLFLEQGGERAVVACLTVELTQALANRGRLERSLLRRFETGTGALAVAERRVGRGQANRALAQRFGRRQRAKAHECLRRQGRFARGVVNASERLERCFPA